MPYHSIRIVYDYFMFHLCLIIHQKQTRSEREKERRRWTVREGRRQTAVNAFLFVWSYIVYSCLMCHVCARTYEARRGETRRVSAQTELYQVTRVCPCIERRYKQQREDKTRKHNKWKTIFQFSLSLSLSFCRSLILRLRECVCSIHTRPWRYSLVRVERRTGQCCAATRFKAHTHHTTRSTPRNALDRGENKIKSEMDKS